MTDDDDPTALFESLYVAAAEGKAVVPWDRGGPHPLLEAWGRDADGAGMRAVVIGAGLGEDAEFLSRRGFDVLAFDASPTAVATARRRHPQSAVRYRTANLLDLPADWEQAFDFVLESLTVQSMPIAYRVRATRNVARLVAPGGTLLVVATGRDDDEPPSGPPWPLTRAEVESFAGAGLDIVQIEDVRDPGVPQRWRAEFRRPGAAPG